MENIPDGLRLCVLRRGQDSCSESLGKLSLNWSISVTLSSDLSLGKQLNIFPREQEELA